MIGLGLRIRAHPKPHPNAELLFWLRVKRQAAKAQSDLRSTLAHEAKAQSAMPNRDKASTPRARLVLSATTDQGVYDGTGPYDASLDYSANFCKMSRRD